MKSRISIAVRLGIWLAAIAIPVHTCPAANCGCSNSCFNSRAIRCCCSPEKREGHTCCCFAESANCPLTCCSQGDRKATSETGCSGNCRCGQSKTPAPFTPTSQESPAEKVSQEAHSANPTMLISIAKPSEHKHANASQSDALTALDRCAALCRFTL